MHQKLPMDAVTSETTDWTCKVQVVNKSCPRTRSDSSMHFQIVLVQDESEHQVSIVLYGVDILKYENLFGLFEIYLVLCTKVREPHSYSIRADLLAVIVNCSAIQYTTDQSKHFSEVIVIDQSKKPFLFTIRGDLADNERAALLHHLHEYPVIFSRRIGVTEFRGALILATRYQLTILTNPQYVQATTLKNWVKHNERMLLSYTLRNSSSSSLNLTPIEDQALAISTIPELLSTVQCFPVEAKLSLPDCP
ncbi:hypothetical protein CQW23_14203 [Capsicum baccatum]|uniref:Uncharacterized protein n=1 Tax=Capsicum baccatum TaxID=33114 RepID=A0A2G2WIH2_CAPBA|nr:hypothetical protein CQW23_14203 [Capsicum baccatum]